MVQESENIKSYMVKDLQPPIFPICPGPPTPVSQRVWFPGVLLKVSVCIMDPGEERII